MTDLTKAAGKDHRSGGEARYLAEREGSCFVFGRELLSWTLSTVCWWIELAGGDAGLGFSKGRRQQPCGSLKRTCCHAWTQEIKVYAPAQGRGPLFLSGLKPPLLPTEGSPSIQVRVGCNTASQGIVFSCWCLLCYFSASVRPLSPAQSLGQFGRPHFSEGTSQPSDCRALG